MAKFENNPNSIGKTNRDAISEDNGPQMGTSHEAEKINPTAVHQMPVGCSEGDNDDDGASRAGPSDNDGCVCEKTGQGDGNHDARPALAHDASGDDMDASAGAGLRGSETNKATIPSESGTQSAGSTPGRGHGAVTAGTSGTNVRPAIALPADRPNNPRGRASAGPGATLRRYACQPLRGHTPYPFPSRSDILDPLASTEGTHASTVRTEPGDSVVFDRADATGTSQPAGAPAPTSPASPASEGGAKDASVVKGDLSEKSPSLVQPAILVPADRTPLSMSKLAVGIKIDKSTLWLGLERRIRDKAHLRRVAELPCLVCSRQPSHAHHLRFAQRHGLSQKVSDEYVVPLCAIHHGDLHRHTAEREWWVKQNIDPLPLAAELWAKHH